MQAKPNGHNHTRVRPASCAEIKPFRPPLLHSHGTTGQSLLHILGLFFVHSHPIQMTLRRSLCTQTPTMYPPVQEKKRMQPTSTISYHWLDPTAGDVYHAGVSLHSHTSHSLETFSFLRAMCDDVPFAPRILQHYDERNQRISGLKFDFDAAHWRPPLVPLMAFELESKQIQALGLEPMISITDHDDVTAPLLLRTIPGARRIPVSLEWTVPFGTTAFHLGVHNLPSSESHTWMQTLAQLTAHPSESALSTLLRRLDDNPHILIVLNHPRWDLYKIGDQEHDRELERFLDRNNHLIHALELNGLRHAQENNKVEQLARRWDQLLVSGGDRHGLEPNANINLTDAGSFHEFVQEIRCARRSHILFLKQYSLAWEQRILDSTLDAITDHPHFSPGWQRWDERAFHPDSTGVIHPLTDFWKKGRAPLPLHLFIHAIRLLRYRKLAHGFSKMLGYTQGSSDRRNVFNETA